MDVSKLQEAVAELRAEAQECLRLASDIEARIKRATNGSGQSPTKGFKLKFRKKKSLLTHAIDVLREQGKPTHISEIVPKVAEKSGKQASRASVEAALIRGIDSKGVKRTEPGTYALV